MRPDPLANYRTAPLEDLLTILLRQFRRPLATRQIHISDADAAALAKRIIARETLTDADQAIRAALADLVRESEAVLARWSLTFEQSLKTPIGEIPGWESTADFLDLAAEKTNAELRISTGSALLAALGDRGFAANLRTVIASAEPDLETVIAERVLAMIGERPQQ